MTEITLVYLLHSMPSVGGLERMSFDLLRHLPAHGIRPVLCCMTGGGELADRLNREYDIDVHVFGMVSSMSLKYLFRNIREMKKLVKLLKNIRPDIIHGNEFFTAAVARLAARRAGVPHAVITLHSQYKHLGTIHRRINRTLAKRTDAIICVSEAVKNHSIEQDRISPERYHVIYNGSDLSKFQPDPDSRRKLIRELGVSDDTKIIGMVGTLVAAKAYDLAIETFIELQKKEEKSCLVIVGGESAEEPESADTLRRLINENNLTGKVFLFGRRNDIVYLYSALDVFLITSLNEGFGIALIEAMASGVPCVAPVTPPFPEIISEKSIGYLCERSGSALAEKIMYILNNPDEAQKTGLRGRKYVLEHFTTERMVEKYALLYNMLK